MAFECNICEKAFANRYELRIHMHTHKKERTFKYDKCEKAFTESRYLKSHKHLHDEEKPFKCNNCPKAFKLSQYLKRHFRIHRGEKPFKCNNCPKAFKLAQHLKIHLRIHTGERPFKCNKCPKAFSQSGNLKIHLRIHSGERPFKCIQCHEAFTRSEDLKIHFRIHTGERPFKCNKCPKTFRRSESLKMHFRIHTGERPFKCNKCPKAFRKSGHLKDHLRIHTGEKPYKCNKCTKTFRQSGNLKIHLRIHREERQLKCDKCSKTFSSSQYLKKHECSHKRETTFKCAKCSKVFTQSEDFKRHELTHIWRPYDFNLTTPTKTCEEEKTFKYHQCDITFLAKDNLKPHMHETRSEDEANHSMRSYVNIQSSTLIQSEKHTFQYGIFDQNIPNHSNSSIRFNSLDEITFPHQFIPPNIQMRILPSDIHVKTQGSKNIPMSILDKSIKHPQKRVSFAAGSIEQMSSISNRPEENQFNFDNPLNVFTQYEMPGQRLSLNALPSMHEYQQPNATEESFLNTNTGSTPTNRDMESQIHIINLVPNTSDQNFANPSIQNQESVSTASEHIESNISKEHSIIELFPRL